MAPNSPPLQIDFRLLFESAPSLYLVLDPELHIVAVNDAYLQATLTQRDKIVGKHIFDVFPDNPSDPQATGVRNLSESLNRVLTNRISDAMAVQKYDIRRPDSEGGGFEERYWSPVNTPVLGPDQKLVYVIHRVEDVTEFITLKRRNEEQFGISQQLRQRTEEMEIEIFERAQQIQEANRELREAKTELEQRVQLRTLELAQSNESLRAEIEQKKRLEEQYRHAQKMEAIGTLAGGIAHDFNNLLTVISGYSEILLETTPPTDPSFESLEEIHKAGNRAASLTRQLLAFSRQQVLELRVLDLNEILRDTEKMLRRLIGEDIQLITKLEPKLGTIRADSGQIEQIIVNLVVNARDAMQQGGQLTIETANIELDDSYARTHLGVDPGWYVMLVVTDTGCGMDETTKSRIFEPFFTTKGPNKGTGLGLATVFGIVKQFGGTIWVYSEVGHGTTLKIYFPHLQESVSENKSKVTQQTIYGSETILLVEDEDAVRAVTQVALESMGYRVFETRTGAEAIQFCQQFQEPIHLLVSDVVMPMMGGSEVAAAITKLRPEIKVLFLSGYTDDTVIRYGVLQEKVAFVQKPFSPKFLGRKIRELLATIE